MLSATSSASLSDVDGDTGYQFNALSASLGYSLRFH